MSHDPGAPLCTVLIHGLGSNGLIIGSISCSAAGAERWHARHFISDEVWRGRLVIPRRPVREIEAPFVGGILIAFRKALSEAAQLETAVTAHITTPAGSERVTPAPAGDVLDTIAARLRTPAHQ
jgi:hypothetical protein